MPIRAFLAAVIALTLTAACSTPSTTQPLTQPVHPIYTPVETGDYTGSSPYYFVQGSVRYAVGTDGNIYALRRAEQPGGFVGGSGASTPECWIRPELSLNQCYRRTWSSFQGDGQPTFR